MEIYNLGMTGQVIKDLLGTVQSNAASWSQGATIATQALRYTTQTLKELDQDQARLNIDAQKAILQYKACTVTTTTTTYTGFAVGAFGIDMSTTSNFGFAFGVPNYWYAGFDPAVHSPLDPSAPGFNATALGAAIANGDFSLAAGGGYARIGAPYTDWTNKCPETTAYTSSDFIGARADGTYSFAQGTHVIANGDGAFVRGSIILAMGKHSTGIGNDILTTTNATYAMGQGYGLIVDGKSQFVHGQYNFPLGSEYLEVVGGGAARSNRKNIYTLDTLGNIHIRGKIYQNCTDDSCIGHGGSGVLLWTNPSLASPTAISKNTFFDYDNDYQITQEDLNFYHHLEIIYCCFLGGPIQNTSIRLKSIYTTGFLSEYNGAVLLTGARASASYSGVYRRQINVLYNRFKCQQGYYSTNQDDEAIIPMAIYLVP